MPADAKYSLEESNDVPEVVVADVQLKQGCILPHALRKPALHQMRGGNNSVGVFCIGKEAGASPVEQG